MARMRRNQRATHRLDLAAAARLRPIMVRRGEAGKVAVAPTVAKAVLYSLVNYGGVEGRAWPSRLTLADEAETSISTVKRVIEIFIEEGFIRQVTDRSRARRPKGEGSNGTTNVYHLDYDVLRSWGDDGYDESTPNAVQDEPRSGASMDRDAASERGSTEGGTRSNGDGIAVQIPSPSKEVEPSGTVSEPPPQPPAGGSGGGGEGAHRRSQPSAIVRSILDAFPPSDMALFDDDATAVEAAIARESKHHDGVTPAEIHAAALAYADAHRRGRVRSPLSCRTWLERGGYVSHVSHARAIAAKALAPSPPVVDARAGKRTADEAEVLKERAETDRLLASLEHDDFLALRQRAIDLEPTGFMRGIWQSSNPDDPSMTLKGAMGRLLRKERRQELAMAGVNDRREHGHGDGEVRT